MTGFLQNNPDLSHTMQIKPAALTRSPLGWTRYFASLLCLICGPLAYGQGSPIISEFMASNEETLVLANGESPDWIELHNPGAASVDLAGWSLSDNSGSLDKWTFPAGAAIPVGGHLLVYASGQDLRNPEEELHTNFNLSQDGEFLALIDPQGEITQLAFSPAFPEQFTDISFGVPQDQTEPAYFSTPTPGEANNDSVLGFVKDTSFSHKRGFFEEPFQLEVTTVTPGASIFYTTDGSDPGPTSSSVDAPDPDTPPILSLEISTTTIVRAYAAKSGFQDTNIDTQSYFFLDEVINNPVMATSVTEHPVWGPQMRDTLLEIPTISLVTQEVIPTTPIMSPPEIPVSIEMIFPNGRDGFQLDAGVERFGGQFTVYDKNALRVSFKEIYGKKKLKFDLFSDTPYGGDSAVESFDQILLRNGSHDSLFATNYAHSRGVYFRNRYFLDRQLEAGHLSMRGKFVHVYLNGTYYGQHHLMERPNADFMATHLGGEEEEYDIMKGRSGIFVSQGEGTAWNYLNSNKSNYKIVKDYMNIDSYIDYMLLNFYGGNEHDWYPQHNWVAGRKREDGGKFNFFMWDNDFLIRRGGNSSSGSTANTTDNGGPGNMWSALIQLPEFKIRVADRVQKHFYGEGMLTTERVQSDVTELAKRISRTIIPESARWGTKAPQLYTPASYQSYVNWIVDVNAESRTNVVLGQMRSAGFLPNTAAPQFSQNGGEIPADFPLLVTHADGDLYYTTDGSDPRLEGGEINPTAQRVEANTLVFPAGETWKYDDSGTDNSSNWQTSPFDDSGWQEGPAPLGFGRITNTTIATTVNSTFPRKVTVYFRKTFQITYSDSISTGFIDLHADGGAVVYINGTEVTRDNMPTGAITPDTISTTDGNEGEFDTFPFDGSLLLDGENLITVELHNRSAGSSDMVFDLKLSYESNDRTATIPINGTIPIRARVLNESDWSGLNEAIFIGDQPASSENLVISEIHYNPGSGLDGNSEFIELMNISDQTISLAGMTFTEGITFTFDEQATLAPSGHVVLVFDRTFFEAKYGNDFPIGGIYTSRLANNGERITLTAADGLVIQSLKFDTQNQWPALADGTGYSLTLASPLGNPDPSLPQSWRTSIELGGSPLTDDSFPLDIQSPEDLLYAVTGSAAPPVLTIKNDQLIFEHQRLHGADGASFVVEYSTDLENWNSENLIFLDQTNTGIGSSGIPGSKLRWVLPAGLGQPVFARIKAMMID